MTKRNKKKLTLINQLIIVVTVVLLLSGLASGFSIFKSAQLTKARSLTSTSPILSMKNLISWFETTSKRSFINNENVDNNIVTSWKNIYHPGLKVSAKSHGDPSYISNAINYLPAIEFDGNDYYSINDLSSIFNGKNKEITIFTVSQDTRSNLLSETTLLSLGLSTDENSRLYIDNNLEANYRILKINDSGTVIKKISGGKVTNLPEIRTSIINHTASVRVNGKVVFYNEDINVGNANFNLGTIGALRHFSTTSSLWKGYIGEVIIFNKILDQNQIIKVENYLSKKWRIKIDN